ncbi:MAG: putative quinol monooxygenase [Sporichthyaceae bacterium]
MSATATPTLTLSFVATLVAKPEHADDVADLLRQAASLAQDEVGTIVWYALRTDATTFWIVDAFETEQARQAHINGPIAAALGANAHLFAEAPVIRPGDVLAVKA